MKLFRNKKQMIQTKKYKNKIRNKIQQQQQTGKKWTVRIKIYEWNYKMNKYSGERCKICSKLTIKTPERSQQRRFGVFIVNFEHTSHLLLVFILLNLNE